MREVVIKQICDEKECWVCDDFLSRLSSFDSQYDNIIESDFKFKDIHLRNKDDEFTYIALAFKEEPIGYVFAYVKSKKGKVRKTNVIDIQALFVDKNYRRQKVGEKLVKSVENWASTKFDNDYVIELQAINDNINAMEFYRNLGFKEIRTVFRK